MQPTPLAAHCQDFLRNAREVRRLSAHTVAAYRRDGAHWHCEQAPAVCKPYDVTVPPGSWTGAGDGFAQYPMLASRLGLANVHVDARPSARAIALLAMPRVETGATMTARDALPAYVRHRVALTSAERDAGVRL